MGKLNVVKVRKAGPGVYGDGAGLYLRVKPTGAKSWVLRVQHAGKREDIGLGSVSDLSLDEARERAAHLRRLARRGLDARMERDRELVVVPTFAKAIEATHAELSKGWSDKAGEAFKSSLETHAVPKLGRKRVSDITGEDVIAALAPIWTEKPQQARKVRHRIMQVLSFAKSRGWRSEPVPDAIELRRGLAKQPRSQGFAAMPYRDVPGFVREQLGNAPSPARLALIFAILTAARSGEVRHADWGQIDLEAHTWSRPASLMKSGVDHVVTLNRAAIDVLKRAAALYGKDGPVFPSVRDRRPLSDAAMSKLLRDAGRPETVHGFRSSFRDWAAEQMPTVPAMVPEMALAHAVGDAVQQAYLRSDLRDLRRELMEAWGEFAMSKGEV